MVPPVWGLYVSDTPTTFYTVIKSLPGADPKLALAWSLSNAGDHPEMIGDLAWKGGSA